MEHGKRFAFILAVVLFGTSLLANAEIITYQLSSAFEREYNYDTPASSTAFDLGATFTEISNLYIDWSGEIMGEETLNAGVIDCMFVATLYELDHHDYFGRAYVQGGAATYPDPTLFDLQSSFTAEDWADLLDGQSTIEIWFGVTSHPLGLGSGEPGTGQLSSATLIVEGTVIPEPATFVLTVIGIFCVRKKHGTLK